MRVFPRSDNSWRLSPAVLLLLGALSLVARTRGQLEEDVGGEPEESDENATRTSAETEITLETNQEPAGEIDVGTILELYEEYHQPVIEEHDDDGDGSSRLSLHGLVGMIRRRGRNFPRSSLLECPSEAAPRGPFQRAKMLYYNPERRRTTGIEESRDGGWRGSDIESLKRAGLDLSKPTVAIMGGYLQTEFSEWILLFKRRVAQLANGAGGRVPFNLLIFDWGAYSIRMYERSVSFVPHLSSVLAKFFEHLVDTHGYKLSLVQLISFSLSTHICGNAGRKLKSKYGQPIEVIHALDPTGVCFHDQHAGSRFAQEYALRPTDAKLVLARHYNMKQLGAGHFIGGVDIVVNDGSRQPVMFPERFSVSSVLEIAGIAVTSHMRAVEHETTLVPDFNSECHEIAYECSSYEAFNAGECGHCRAQNQSCFHISTLGNFRMDQRPAEMNFKQGTTMYVTTGESKFCEHTFQVVARLDAPSDKTIGDFRSGKFKVDIGDLEVRPTHHVTGDKKVLFTQLLRPSRLPSPFPESVQVGASVRPLLDSVKYVALTHMSHISREVRRNHSIKYCRDSSSEGTLVKCK